MATKTKAWTDEDMSYVADTMERPASEIAERLGRTLGSVYAARHRLRHTDWTGRSLWSPEEDEVLAVGRTLTSIQLAARLPGRTASACQSRRVSLGLPISNHYLHADPSNHYSRTSPLQPGNRPLLARTCTKCGRLLPAGWFRFSGTRKHWHATCRHCEGAKNADLHRRKLDDSDYLTGAAQRSRVYRSKAQAITSARARRHGWEYTEADFAILADPTKTALAKALILQRTYRAVHHQLVKIGYKSHVGLGDPERDAWSILNPNEPYVEEITARLAAAAAPPVPAQAAREAQWDWADA